MLPIHLISTQGGQVFAEFFSTVFPAVPLAPGDKVSLHLAAKHLGNGQILALRNFHANQVRSFFAIAITGISFERFRRDYEAVHGPLASAPMLLHAVIRYTSYTSNYASAFKAHQQSLSQAAFYTDEQYQEAHY